MTSFSYGGHKLHKTYTKIGSPQSLLWDIGKEPSPDGSCPLNWTLWLWCLEGTQLLLSIHQTLSW
jgi:hypothetical protein